MIVSVNGPMEVPSGHMNVNKAYVDTIFRSKSGQACVNEKFKEQHMRSVCETIIATHLYPRTQITIQIQELITYGNVSIHTILFKFMHFDVILTLVSGARY